MRRYAGGTGRAAQGMAQNSQIQEYFIDIGCL